MTRVAGSGGRHRREGPDDEGSWLDPVTSPLAVYADRDLPYAPVVVRRERAVSGWGPPATVDLVPARTTERRARP